MDHDNNKYQLFIPKYTRLDEESKSVLKSQTPEDIEVKVLNTQINNKFKRNDWLRIQCGSNVIYRVVRGATATGLKSDKIWLSHDSKVELGTVESSIIYVRPCTKWERVFKAPQNSPDPFMRTQFHLSVWISLFGMIAGLLGIILAAASIFLCR